MSTSTISITRFDRPHRTIFARRTGEPLAESLALATMGRLQIHHERLEKGRAASAPHVHSAREEAIVVLAGRPTLRVGDELHLLAAGDCVAIAPGGPPHQLRNEGDEIAEVLTIASDDPEDQTTYA
jgi:uncharacterized cupin superfamily protein